MNTNNNNNNSNIHINLKLLKSLSEETKYKIIEVLLNEEKCACEIPNLIGRTQSNTSMHLKKLLNNNIIKSRRDGKKILYSIKNPKVYDIFKIFDYKIKKFKPYLNKNKA
jgi:ArsR family transcriptional regulator, lead/cadmium/zinc/bismuth-responsive transcriptional repressor